MHFESISTSAWVINIASWNQWVYTTFGIWTGTGVYVWGWVKRSNQRLSLGNQLMPQLVSDLSGHRVRSMHASAAGVFSCVIAPIPIYGRHNLRQGVWRHKVENERRWHHRQHITQHSHIHTEGNDAVERNGHKFLKSGFVHGYERIACDSASIHNSIDLNALHPAIEPHHCRGSFDAHARYTCSVLAVNWLINFCFCSHV